MDRRLTLELEALSRSGHPLTGVDEDPEPV